MTVGKTTWESKRGTVHTFWKSCSCICRSCFFKNSTTSSTFRLDVMLKTITIAFLLTSISALERTCKTSMMRPSSRCPCLERRASSRSRTMNLTLSDSLTTRLMRQAAMTWSASGSQVEDPTFCLHNPLLTTRLTNPINYWADDLRVIISGIASS
jgi:hypothetical protein